MDLCNAASLAHAVPVAVFDTAHVTGGLVVREAMGEEQHLTFSGETENPEPGEVVFADDDGHAHARRWTHRQGRRSTVSNSTTSALVVIEALHDGAPQSVAAVQAVVSHTVAALWGAAPDAAVLSARAPTFVFPA